MDEANPISAQDQYADLLSKVKVMEPHLQLLHRDYLLMTTYGVKFTYAVDFHEIWNYAEPLAKYMGGHQWDNSSLNQDDIYKGQIARAKLFYGLGDDNKCVLLPPYVDELKNKMKLVREKLLREGVPDVNNDFLRQLEKIAENKTIRDAMSEFRKESEVHIDYLEKFPLLLEENVRKLLFYISGIANQGLNIINDLLFGEDAKIKDATSEWPELNWAIQKVTKAKSSEWYGSFQKIRPNQGSESSNFYDAKAIDLLLAINNHIANNKNILVLVSGAPTMKRVFKMRGDHLPAKYISTKADGISVLIPEYNEAVPLFRPIETYYYLTLFSASTDKGILSEIDAELDRINRVSILGESIKKLQPSCDNCKKDRRTICTFSEGCHNIHINEQLQEHKTHFDAYEEVLLAENRQSIVEPAWRRIVAQKSEFEKSINKTAFALIEYLSQSRKNFDKSLREREDTLRELMDDHIRSALHAVTNFSLYQNEIGAGLENFTRTQYRVDFKDENIEALLRVLEIARDNLDTKLIAESIKKLIDYAYEEQSKFKKQLLWVVLLLCHRLPGQAAELASRTLNAMMTENERDYHYEREHRYVRALSLFVNNEYSKVVLDCEIDIKDYADDPRFYHLFGLTISKKLSKASEAFSYSWDDAIKYTLTAHELAKKESKDSNLRRVLVNNLAYFYCCRNLGDDLDKALYFIDQLKQLTPLDEIEHSPEFLNTIGCVYKELALKEKSSKYAAQGLGNLEKAHELAKDTIIDQGEIKEYERDFRDAEQQLKHIIKLGRE